MKYPQVSMILVQGQNFAQSVTLLNKNVKNSWISCEECDNWVFGDCWSKGLKPNKIKVNAFK